LDITGISVTDTTDRSKFRHHPTAQYVSINDARKNLVVAMADMSIFSRPSSQNAVRKWREVISQHPKWVVIDANWHPSTIKAIIKTCWYYDPDHKKIKIAYEPVSVPKSTCLFHRGRGQPLHPNPIHAIDLATPNQHELAAMHAAAKENEFLDSDEWWKIIDALGIPSTGARDRFVALTNSKLADEGIPLQTIQLLPFIPTILTKLGSEGVLMTALLKPDDPRLTNPDDAPYILSRNANGSTEVGGVYMRLFPAVEEVQDVVSVNGVGDTFLGVVVAGLARGLKLGERLVDVAQRGAVMTLRSQEAVSPDLDKLKEELDEFAGDAGTGTEDKL
jgi:pseudouridine-5'-phosphate glycosidase/pseudouridine kinase